VPIRPSGIIDLKIIPIIHRSVAVKSKRIRRKSSARGAGARMKKGRKEFDKPITIWILRTAVFVSVVQLAVTLSLIFS